jgi:hypothetical protein
VNKVTEILGLSFADKLNGFKFEKSHSHLIKMMSSGWQAIVISASPTSTKGLFRLESHGHVRINEIENIYTPFHLFLAGKSAKNHPTIVINCDRLLSDKSFIDGFFDDDKSIESFATRYAEALQDDVLPWLEKYSNEQELFDGLIDKDPTKWITSDRLTRFQVLLAILAKRDQVVEFDCVANEFLTYCEKPHAKIYEDLAVKLISGLRGEMNKSKIPDKK